MRLSYYDEKIAQCRYLAERTDDPLEKAVYEAMAAEFIGKAREEEAAGDASLPLRLAG